MEGEVHGLDEVVAEEHDAAERRVREEVGLGQAAEDAVGELSVGAHEARDEPFGAEDGLGGGEEVGDEWVLGVGHGGPGT